MQNTIANEGDNGYDPNKIIVSERELTTDRLDFKDRLPEPTITTLEVETPPTFNHQPTPKQKKPIALILAGLGLGAIAASVFGYRYWQFISTHQTTDNATVFGHVHQISSKIGGTVAQVLVTDNQQVKPGQLLVKLDPQDYENKVQQAQAALESARRQTNAAQAGIALASQTTTG